MSMITNDPQALAIAATSEGTLKQVTSWDALEAICLKSNTKPYIMSQTKTYYSIDVSVAMKELTQVGTLLQTAFAGTKGFKSNGKVALILANYQTLIKDSNVVSRTFVEACLLAIKYHRMVLVVAEKPNGLEKALKLYSKCAQAATTMAAESDKLVKMCESLIETTKQALVSACDDEAVETKRKEEVIAMIAELEAKKVQLEETTKALNEHVEEARNREREAAKRADEAEKRAFITGLVSAGMSAVTTAINPMAGIIGQNKQAGNSSENNGGNNTNMDLAGAMKELAKMQSSKNTQVAELEGDLLKLKEELTKAVDDQTKKQLEKDIKEKTSSIKTMKEEVEKMSQALKDQSDKQHQVANSARDVEAQAAQDRAALQKELREQNGELKKSLQLLSSTHEEKNFVEQAIAALEVSVKSLGRVVTIFGNTKQFWEGVKKQCEALAAIEGTASEWVEVDEKQEFIEEIKLSALKWLSLGNITRLAALSMGEVDKNVDKIMTDLPTREEANELLNSVAITMIEGLEEEENKGLLEG